MDEYGQRDRSIAVKLDSSGNVTKSITNEIGDSLSYMDVVMNRIYERYLFLCFCLFISYLPHLILLLLFTISGHFNSLGTRRSVNSNYYIDFKNTLPWCAKKYEQSFICYTAQQVRVTERDAA